MDLLKTILVYLSMVYVSAVQSAPEYAVPPSVTMESPSAVVTTAAPTAVPTPTNTPVPTPAITPNNDYKTIRVGDNGETVLQMQRRLADLGYYNGDIDGRFGNQTRRAVERFQYNQGLQADGIAGKRTLTVLYESDEVRAAPVEETPAQSNVPTQTPGGVNAPSLARTLSPDEQTPAPTFVPTHAPSPSLTPKREGEAADDADLEGSTGDSLPDEEGAAEIPSKGGDVAGSNEVGNEEGAMETEQPLSVEEYVIKLAGSDMPIMVEGTKEFIAPLYVEGRHLFVPLMEVLREAQIVVIPFVGETADEYAFTVGQNLFHLSYDKDEAGNVSNVVFTKDGQPQLMTNRVAVLQEGMIYLPVADVEAITGIHHTLDVEEKTLFLQIPTVEPEA